MLDLVNPRIGTGRHGNCLIGPCLPFGLVRLGPDISYPQPTSGYRPGKPIIGFSHTHLSGTGGAARYGNLRFMPIGGAPRQLGAFPFLNFPATHRRWSVPELEEASVGAYRCRFPDGVEAELTCTRRAGVHRYTFPEGLHPHLLIDFAALLQTGTAPPGSTPYCETWEMEGRHLHATAERISPHEISGSSTCIGGWGHFHPYTIFFFVRSREPFEDITFAGEQGVIEGSCRAEGPGLRAICRYPASIRQAHLEVGISHLSTDLAREAVERETTGASFEDIRSRAREAWRPYLDRIAVEGGTPDQQTLLATSLLRLFTLPTDRAVETGGPPRFTDIPCLWDSIRNANSLQHLLAPEFSADLMNSLLHTAEETGWLPDAHISGEFAYQQSGCAAEILFSEAARKGIPGVDYRAALAACVRNAETLSDDPTIRGRYLDDYEQLGYCSTRVPKASVSRHIEYAMHDWCIARLAETLGETATASRFDAKSRRLWNLWHPSLRIFMPRNPDGSWVEAVDPEQYRWDGWNDPYSYEGSLGFWSFNGLHDIPGLIARHGGAHAFSAHLDAFLAAHPKVEKETRMHIPHLYQFVGRPDRTAEIIRRSLETSYANSPDGLPDDEDMGCQSGYFIANSIGLYPLFGHTLYSLVPPLFKRSTLRLGHSGRTLTITRRGDGPHLRAVRLNGNAFDSFLLDHRLVANGGNLELEVG